MTGPHPVSTLLAFVEGDESPELAETLHDAVAQIAAERAEWQVGPPQFVNETDDDGTPTLGAVLRIHAPSDDLPEELDRAAFEDVRAFIAGLQPVSAEAEVDIGLELDQDSVGWIESGQLSHDLRAGLLEPWAARFLNLADAVRDLYLAQWGTPSREARFDVAEYGIEVLKWAPGSWPEGAALYATVGASTRPLERADPYHRIELFTGLAPEQDDIASPLAALDLYSAREGVALGHGHTVPNDGPLWPGTSMDIFLVVRPRTEVLAPLALPGGLHEEFLQAIPISQSERAFKAEHGADAFLERWEREGIRVWDSSR